MGVHHIRDLTKQQAISLYKKQYWDKANLNQYHGNPAHQALAFDALIHQGNGQKTIKMIKDANGNPEALFAARKEKLHQLGTQGRQRRMAKMQDMIQEICDRPTTASLDAAEELLQEKKQVAFTFHYARQQQALARALDKVDKLATEQKSTEKNERDKQASATNILKSVTEPKIYTPEIAASFRKGSPEVPIEKTWKERMHALYTQNRKDSTYRSEPVIVTAPTLQHGV